jgi:hypothetical protein
MAIRSECQRTQANNENVASAKSVQATIAPYAKTEVTA